MDSGAIGIVLKYQILSLWNFVHVTSNSKPLEESLEEELYLFDDINIFKLTVDWLPIHPAFQISFSMVEEALVHKLKSGLQ